MTPYDDPFDESGFDPDDAPEDLAAHPTIPVYEIVWSATAVNLVTLLGHLATAMLFGVFDLEAVRKSIVMFSLFIWSVALLVLLAFAARLLLRLALAPGSERPPPFDDEDL